MDCKLYTKTVWYCGSYLISSKYISKFALNSLLKPLKHRHAINITYSYI